MKKTIFIAEDDQTLNNMYRTMFEIAGYETFMATNGKEALDKLEAMEQKPGLIISDIVMPYLDGFGLLEKIKQDPSLKEIPVIMLTNLPIKLEDEKAKNMGALRCLAKTEYDAKEVVAVSKAIMEQYESKHGNE